MNIFKWLKKKNINCPIFWLITEEMIQEEAEQEINRRLTEKELFELFEAQYFDEDVVWNRMVMIREAISKLVLGEGDDKNEKT